MNIGKMLTHKELCFIFLLLTSVSITGCTGIKPYEPRGDREEGPEKGLFSGEQGEFVIHRKEQETVNKTSQ